MPCHIPTPNNKPTPPYIQFIGNFSATPPQPRARTSCRIVFGICAHELGKIGGIVARASRTLVCGSCTFPSGQSNK